MNEDLHQAYFLWLGNQVRIPEDKENTYWDLLYLMHHKEFVWLVPNDDNRIVDGMDLRVEFLHENNVDDVMKEDFGVCSVLEVMIGLSRRISFLAGGEPEGWAWQLLDNLKLSRMSDPLSDHRARRANAMLEALLWRTYQKDGTGGFFPLNFPEDDQTGVEIWNQMTSYINEIHPEY